VKTLLVTGACGFVGSTLIRAFREHGLTASIVGVDNLIRPGSERNRRALRPLGVRFVHADVRSASDFEALPPADFVIDAAALPNVLAGVDGATSSRQLLEHNLLGTVNLLEYCRRHGAGFVLLSTSRVYSIPALAAIPLVTRGPAFVPDPAAPLEPGRTADGISETFPAGAPASLYGSSKLASEQLALEYGAAFGFPVFVDRCGLLTGAGQFGRPDQGIFSYWIHAWRARAPLRYIGFGGTGRQVRDALHPADLAPLLLRQMEAGAAGRDVPRIVNFGGGLDSAMSLRQLSDWCRDRFGPHEVSSDPANRPFDVPWLVLDAGLAARTWSWKPERPVFGILEEIARHAEANPDWLEVSAP
jgi:CDP-paratose 2-epimerase